MRQMLGVIAASLSTPACDQRQRPALSLAREPAPVHVIVNHAREVAGSA
jgi:hypothetical protein